MAEIKKISTELQLLDKFLDTSGDAGTLGQILSSTATGINWINGSAIPGVPGGSGTLRTIPMWTPDGDTLGNSVLKQDVANQNIGLGITPETGMVTYVAQLRIGEQSAIQGHTDGVGADSATWVTTNYKFTPTGAQFINGTTSAPGYANIYQQQVGEHTFLCSTASGVAGGAVTSRMQMVIKQTGNVGIGTTSPGTLHSASYGFTRLHIDGGTDRGQMIIEGDAFAGIVLSDNGATANQRVFATSVDETKYTIKPLNDNGTSTAGGVAFTVLHGGNVGIGETSPSEKLEVAGQYGNTKLNGHVVAYTRAAGNYLWASAVGGDLRFTVNGNLVGSPAMMISTAGNVGIGTTGPGRKLTVAGDVSGDANNLLLSNENDTDGDSASIGFSMLSNNTYVKSGIFFKRTTTQGRGDLIFANNNEVNGNNVTLSDAKITIQPAGAIKFNAYDSTNNTGSPTHILGTDANGLIVKSTAGSSIGPWLPLAAGSGDPLTGDLYINKSAPALRLNDSGDNVPYELRVDGTTFSIKEVTNSRTLMSMTAGAVITLDSLGSNTVINTVGAMVVPNGKVGIGTTSPDAPLHILKAAGGANIVTALKLDPDDATAGSGVSIDFNASTTNTGASLVGSRIVGARQGGNASGFLALYTSPDASGSVPLERMRIDSAGNVGIGTASPDAKLHVKSASAGSFTYDTTADDLIVESNANGGMTIATAAANTGRIIFASPDDATGSEISFNQASTLMKLGTTTGSGILALQSGNGSEAMRIDSSGNVGIGTTSPSDYDDESDNLVIAEGFNGTNPTPGITIACLANQATTGRGSIRFADGTTGNEKYRGALEYNHSGDDMSFRTAGTVKMVLTDGGEVGIGTTSPEAKLHVYNGNASIAPNGDGDEFVIENSGNAGMSILTGNTSNGAIFFGDAQDNNVGIIDYDHNINTMSFTTGASKAITINASQNVGIGTTGPGEKLEVNGNIRIHNTSNAPYIDFVESGATSDSKARITMDQTDTNNGALLFATEGSGTLSERMRITSSGNVGINVTNPTEKLHVVGNIFCSLKFGNLVAGTSGVQFEAATTATQTCRFDSDEMRFFAGGGAGEVFTMLNSTGATTFTNTVTATNFILSSDERLKENIKTLEPKVISADWKSFNAKNDDSYRTGVIAQELEKKHPEFVETNDKGFKSVKYIDLLISKIAELEARLEKAGI